MGIRIHYVNKKMFSDKNEITRESAYILGLMWADGSISKQTSKRYLISFTGVSDDLEIIENTVMSTGSWGIYKRIKDGQRDQTTYGVSDKELYEMLCSLDYDKKSINSAIKVLDIIPEQFKHYWWRGFFEGDGCIYTTKNNQLFFTGPLNVDWSYFKELPINLNWKHIKKETRNGNYSRMMLYGRDKILEFCDYIYDNRENDNIGFERKYIKYVNMKNNPPPKRVYKYGRGVYLDKKRQKWVAKIRINNAQYHLGTFSNEKDALLVVENKKRELGVI